MLSKLAGKPAPRSLLVDVPRLITAYYTERPDPGVAGHRVVFGTSGHRGSSLRCSFNEAHIIAITQAICEHRRRVGIGGPLLLGRDTHALSEPAHTTVLEVLAGNGVPVLRDSGDRTVPTPAVSLAILQHNRGANAGQHADGIVITPSHNPPSDGGLKYNPSHGGPAGTEATQWIAARANALLEDGLAGVTRLSHARALAAEATGTYDFLGTYVEQLGEVLDMPAIAAAGLRLGVDPLGGAGVGYWGPIAERYGIALDIVDDVVDPTFAFMCVDKDGKIRMDCSSPYAMAGLVAMADRYDVAWGNDTDFDRHGIVTRNHGLLDPNHYLAVAVDYLFARRDQWSRSATVGKTLVSSSMIDRVAAARGRAVCEVPVGFKWFVEGLRSGTCGFGGEESAGASFLRRDGRVWTTDKDGIIMGLLAAEITACTGKDPGEHYVALTERFGAPAYARIDAPATAGQKAVLAKLSPDQVRTDTLAGESIVAKLTRAPGNDAPIGGLKVTTANGWFAARPSGTEDVYKIYAESFAGAGHLAQIQAQAQEIVSDVFAAAGV